MNAFVSESGGECQDGVCTFLDFYIVEVEVNVCYYVSVLILNKVRLITVHLCFRVLTFGHWTFLLLLF